MSLNCLGIPRAGVVAFAGALGVPVSARPDRTGPNELRRDYPGSVSAYFSHQVAFSIGATLAIIALAAGDVVGWAALTGQFATPSQKPVALGVTPSERGSGRQSAGGVADVTVSRVDNPARVPIPESANEPGTHFVGVDPHHLPAGSSVDRNGGRRSLYGGAPLQRTLRDIHTHPQHGSLNDTTRAGGRGQAAGTNEGWARALSSLKSLLETGRPLPSPV